jgi:iron complex outermembrane receptor protein
MPGWSVTPRIDVSHQSDVFTTALNTPLDQDPSREVVAVTGTGVPVHHPDRISGYTLANARITWRNHEGDWQAAFEVTNFTDKLYYLTYFDQAGAVGYLGAQPAMGRQWAVTVKKTF